MFEIAGGILLAVFILAFLPALLALVGGALLVLVGVALLFLTAYGVYAGGGEGGIRLLILVLIGVAIWRYVRWFRQRPASMYISAEPPTGPVRRWLVRGFFTIALAPPALAAVGLLWFLLTGAEPFRLPTAPAPAAATMIAALPEGSPPAALPEGSPPGSVEIGTLGGRPVFRAPDGRRFMATRDCRALMSASACP